MGPHGSLRRPPHWARATVRSGCSDSHCEQVLRLGLWWRQSRQDMRQLRERGFRLLAAGRLAGSVAVNGPGGSAWKNITGCGVKVITPQPTGWPHCPSGG